MIYFPLINSMVFGGESGLDPGTGGAFAGRAQRVPLGGRVPVQLYTDEEYYPAPRLEYSDGTSGTPVYDVLHTTEARRSDGLLYRYVTYAIVLPPRRCFRLLFATPTASARSLCVDTWEAPRPLRRCTFAGEAFLEYDAVLADGDFSFTPVLWVEGGFFTSGFTPLVDGEEFIDQNRVTRYTSLYPSITRDFVMGGAHGLDNRLAAALNACFCLPRIEIDGRAYVRYAGAALKSLGDKAVPTRAWSLTLQHAGGDWSVAYGSGTVDGALVDASGRYVVDASGRWIDTGQ